MLAPIGNVTLTTGYSFPGPGTAAFFGAAVASLAFLKDFTSCLAYVILVVDAIIATSLLVSGIWIERTTFREKADDGRNVKEREIKELEIKSESLKVQSKMLDLQIAQLGLMPQGYAKRDATIPPTEK